MNKDEPKSKTRPAAANRPKRDTVALNITGRVQHDERGHAIWEWAGKNGQSGGDANSPLSIVDEARRVEGYSPYDSGQLEKERAPRKKKDLRRLSEWLKLEKQAAKNRSKT